MLHRSKHYFHNNFCTRDVVQHKFKKRYSGGMETESSTEPSFYICSINNDRAFTHLTAQRGTYRQISIRKSQCSIWDLVSAQLCGLLDHDGSWQCGLLSS
jgi:hypothetical protein